MIEKFVSDADQRLRQACESASGQAAILQPDHGGRNNILAGRLRLILVPF